MQEQVKQVIAEVLGVDISQVKGDASAKKIEAWDSIRHLNIIMALEERFEIEFDESQIGQLSTVSELSKAIKSKVDA